MSRLRLAWVLGWAIPPAWFRGLAQAALPGDEHVLIEPSPDLWSELPAAGPFDWIVGYSLGSLLLLQNPVQAATVGKVALLAPIWAFPAEAGAGGRIPRANVRALARAYRKSPEAALDSFYALAGIDCEVERDLRARWAEPEFGSKKRFDPARPGCPPGGRIALHPLGIDPARLEGSINPLARQRAALERTALHLWGLEQLERLALTPNLPPSWLAWIGDADPLLDAEGVRALVPQVTVLPNVAHDPAALIGAFSATLSVR